MARLSRGSGGGGGGGDDEPDPPSTPDDGDGDEFDNTTPSRPRSAPPADDDPTPPTEAAERGRAAAGRDARDDEPTERAVEPEPPTERTVRSEPATTPDRDRSAGGAAPPGSGPAQESPGDADATEPSTRTNVSPEPTERTVESEPPTPAEAAERGRTAVDRSEPQVDDDRGPLNDVEDAIREAGEEFETTGDRVARERDDVVGDVGEVTGDVVGAATGGTATALETVQRVDESGERTVELVDESADIIGGDTDEAVDRARRSAVEGDLAGVGDALAGDADEAVDRARRELADGDVAGAGDELAGPLDETAGQAADTTATLVDATADGVATVGASVSSGQAADTVREAIVNQAEAAEAAAEGDFDRAGDELVGGADEFVGQARVDQTTDPTTPSRPRSTTRGGGPSDLTEGGLLTEAQERELKETGATIAGGIDEAVDEGVSAGFAPSEAAADATGVPTDVEASADVPGTGVTLSIDTQQDGETVGERFFEGGIGTAASVVNMPATAASLETAGEVASNAPGEIAENPGRVGEQATAAGRNVAQQAAENPVRTAGSITGGYLSGRAIGRAAPVRLESQRIPTTDGGKTTVRGVRVGTSVTGRRTIAGTSGGSPTVGTPTVDPQRVEFSNIGVRADETFEPVGEFETAVFQATAREAGGTAASRTAAVNDLLDIGDAPRRTQGLAEGIETTADVVREAKAVPSGAEDEIAAALADTDATIFGSAAVKAQAPNFRTPNDVDIVVPDRDAAEARLDEALADYNADVGEVFDIKTVEKAPARARGGEVAKFGRTSREPIETRDGVGVNPVEEELVRKAGASGFVRAPGAAGTDAFDVGPQPRRPGRTDVREKDPRDAATIADDLTGGTDDRVRRFREEFGLDAGDPEPETRRGTGVLGGELGRLREFAGANRAQVDTLGGLGRQLDGDNDLGREGLAALGRELDERDAGVVRVGDGDDRESPAPDTAAPDRGSRRSDASGVNPGRDAGGSNARPRSPGGRTRDQDTRSPFGRSPGDTDTSPVVAAVAGSVASAGPGTDSTDGTGAGPPIGGSPVGEPAETATRAATPTTTPPETMDPVATPPTSPPGRTSSGSTPPTTPAPGTTAPETFDPVATPPPASPPPRPSSPPSTPVISPPGGSPPTSGPPVGSPPGTTFDPNQPDPTRRRRRDDDDDDRDREREELFALVEPVDTNFETNVQNLGLSFLGGDR